MTTMPLPSFPDCGNHLPKEEEKEKKAYFGRSELIKQPLGRGGAPKKKVFFNAESLSYLCLTLAPSFLSLDINLFHLLKP